MNPHLIINWYAIILSVAVAFVFGFLWYGPLFGKYWATLMGYNFEQKPDSKVLRRGIILQVTGLLLTAYVLTYSGQVWRPSVWNAGEDVVGNYMFAFYAAFFTWLGFYVPMQFGKVAWEMRPWKLFFLNVAHDFINLLIMATILAYWR